jgi:hypothetical protein
VIGPNACRTPATSRGTAGTARNLRLGLLRGLKSRRAAGVGDRRFRRKAAVRSSPDATGSRGFGLGGSEKRIGPSLLAKGPLKRGPFVCPGPRKRGPSFLSQIGAITVRAGGGGLPHVRHALTARSYLASQFGQAKKAIVDMKRPPLFFAGAAGLSGRPYEETGARENHSSRSGSRFANLIHACVARAPRVAVTRTPIVWTPS